MVRIKILLKKVNSVLKSFKTRVRKLRNNSDIERWSKQESLSESWNVRTKIISEFVLPNTKVIEFGAGTLALKNYIDSSIEYTPSDIVSRGDDTIVCDLNKPLPSFEKYDYAVFSGVLEYVNNVPLLISHLSPSVKIILASYAVFDENAKNRKLHGWVNNYSENEFVEIFESVGYKLDDRSKWKNQVIFKFVIYNKE